MLKFRRIEIRNFVCFDDIAIEPSIAPERPLTVIRGEPASGKTTLLRAIRWGMYGEKSLPSARFSLHPAWWTPDDNGINTEVSIEFETDGSDRYSDAFGADNKVYLLRRSITTIRKRTDNEEEPDFSRVDEFKELMVKGIDGLWSPYRSVDLVVDQLLPWDLRDFFVMDADEVADDLGGGVNRAVGRNEIIAKTTASVTGLLGIDIFNLAKDRVDGIGINFGKEASKVAGDQTLDELHTKLDRLRSRRSVLKEESEGLTNKLNNIEDKLNNRNDELEIELKGIGAVEEILNNITSNRQRYNDEIEKRKLIVSQLASQIESTELMAILSHTCISKNFDILKPLYDIGDIPFKHLHYVRSLLENGICVCGQDISHDNIYRNNVLEQISKSAEGEERANYLGQVFDATRSLREIVFADVWSKQCHNLASDIVDIDDKLSALETDYENLQRKIDKIDKEKVQILRNEMKSLRAQVDIINRRLAGGDSELSNLNNDIESLEKTIGQRRRLVRIAKDRREAETIANLIVKVLDKGLKTIQEEQVTQLSKKMNILFSQMVHNVVEQDTEHEVGKATFRMIDKVGIKSVKNNPKRYEIFALNNRGRYMSPHELNGASRRGLALSFILALCDESKTLAPLVADSLLNVMAGTVRQNTLLITAKTSNQPILLLTSANLGQSEIDIVDRFAGATYTLTGQWNAIDAGSGGEVINWNDKRLVSLICDCGPRYYCNICERVGWAESPILSKKEGKE